MNHDIFAQEFSRAEEFVAALFNYLETNGGSSYFESDVTQLEHALQSADLARQAGAPGELVTAALLHDIGHLLLGEHNGSPEFLTSDLGHESAGARFLARWFDAAVAVPVALHVNAKRYLVSVDAGYLNSLSPVSKKSLEAQGGPLTSEQAEQFAKLGFAQDAIALRHWDDAAKVAAKNVPPLQSYAPLVARLVNTARRKVVAEPLDGGGRGLL